MKKSSNPLRLDYFFRPFVSMVLGLSICCFLGCQSVETTLPQNFARDPNLDGKEVLIGAIDSQGAVYRVRSVRPKGDGQFEFWKDALVNHLESNGYIKLLEQPTRVSGRTSMLYEFNIPVGGTDYIYQITIIPNGKNLLIAEATGERKTFSLLRESINSAIQKIKFSDSAQL